MPPPVRDDHSWCILMFLTACLDETASLVAEETNAGVTVFITEVASVRGPRCQVCCNCCPSFSVLACLPLLKSTDSLPLSWGVGWGYCVHIVRSAARPCQHTTPMLTAFRVSHQDICRFMEAGGSLTPGAVNLSREGPDETLRSSSWAGVTNENTNMNLYYNTFNAKQANQWDVWCWLPWRRMSISASMDELDNRRMSLTWRSGSREGRRDVVCLILEKTCSPQYARQTWLRCIKHAQCI